MKVRTLIVAGGALTLLVAIGAGAWLGLRPASAGSTSGSCDAALYELSAEKDDGVLEVDFELLSSAPGERWQLILLHDGQTLLETDRVTDEDAEIDLDVDVRPTSHDTFTVTAIPSDGAACVARVTHVG